MIRTLMLALTLSFAVTGCATVNPVAPSKAFETKLLNLYSIGTQSAGQLNYVPNNQVNYAGQSIVTNATASFPIASAVGNGAALATNLTGQGIFNVVDQFQNQSQLVL